MSSRGSLVRKAWGRDLLINLTWLPFLSFWIVGWMLVVTMIEDSGLIEGRISPGVSGILMVVSGGVFGWVLTRFLAKRFGAHCPDCEKSLSLWLMKRRDHEAFAISKACPYCGLTKEMCAEVRRAGRSWRIKGIIFGGSLAAAGVVCALGWEFEWLFLTIAGILLVILLLIDLARLRKGS